MGIQTTLQNGDTNTGLCGKQKKQMNSDTANIRKFLKYLVKFSLPLQICHASKIKFPLSANIC